MVLAVIELSADEVAAIEFPTDHVHFLYDRRAPSTIEGLAHHRQIQSRRSPATAKSTIGHR
jgi:hypothetical protein